MADVDNARFMKDKDSYDFPTLASCRAHQGIHNRRTPEVRFTDEIPWADLDVYIHCRADACSRDYACDALNTDHRQREAAVSPLYKLRLASECRLGGYFTDGHSPSMGVAKCDHERIGGGLRGENSVAQTDPMASWAWNALGYRFYATGDTTGLSGAGGDEL